jgi:AbrB family looped-hinge helix DNA binding protein
MTYTSVSTKYQVVIPKEVRERLEIKPGQKFVIWEKAGVIYLIPALKFKDMEGWFGGMDISDTREESERT